MKKLENKKEAMMEKIMEWSIEREKEKQSEYIKKRKQRIEKNLKLLQEIKKDLNKKYIALDIEVRGATILIYDEDLIKLDILPEEIFEFMTGLLNHKLVDVSAVMLRNENGDYYVEIKESREKEVIIDGENDFINDGGIGILPLKKEINNKLRARIKEKRSAIGKWSYKILENMKNEPYESSIRGTLKDVEGRELNEESINEVIDVLLLKYKGNENIRNNFLINGKELHYIDRDVIVQITKVKQ